MRRNTEDKTLERSYQQKWKFLIHEYELTKKKSHSRFKFIGDFYKAHDISRQTFCKYYNRYRNSGLDQDLLPRRRGPRWKARRADLKIERAVVSCRKRGMSRYEISAVLKKQFHDKTPTPSGVYCILKRRKINRLRPKMKEEKRKIIKKKAGELGHFDCHYLAKDLILNDTKRYYLVCVIDDFSRIAWAEVTSDIKSLTVMFAGLHCMNYINQQYQIKFAEIMTDNGSEFSSRSEKSRNEHPFERMLIETGVKHRYTRPYRPQTNGKIERFWRTLNEDLVEGTVFDSLEKFKEELFQYLIYYNEHRPHQGIDGKIPRDFHLENRQRNT